MPRELKGENLGSFVRGRTFYQEPGKGNSIVAPSTAGDGWSAYALYKDHNIRRDPWTIFEINLQTGDVIPYHGDRMDCWYLARMPDGCIYTFPSDPDADPMVAYVARLNPATGAVERFGPGSPAGWNYSYCWGPDHALYVGGWTLHHAMRFDPVTGEFTDYGPQGPEAEGGLYHVAADDRYLYSTLGGTPYLLNAYHFESGEQEVVATFEPPERAVLVRRAEGVFAVVDRQPKSLLYTQPTDDIVRVYHLEHKRLEPVDALPPEPDEPVGKPVILESSPVCRGDGAATLWYRPPGEAWTSVTFQAGDSPSYMFRLGTFQDKLIGSSEDPYNLFTYDPETGEKSLLGGTDIHTYAFQECDGLVYFVGYSGGPLYVWDPGRPWTREPPNPTAESPDIESPESNPRRVAVFELQRRCHDIVLAADGRLYVPCGAYTESIPGGLLGWYDPASGESGGIRDAFEHAKGVDAETALDGRYVVTATVPWPEPTPAFREADLVIYDTAEQRVTGRVAPRQGCMGPSTIIEWEPGRLIGRFTEHGEGTSDPITTFYVMDVEARSCEMILQVPGVPRNRMIRLDDGRIGCLFGNRITLIDFGAGTHETVGTVDESPRDWMLLNHDLYMILGQEIHRLPGFAGG